MIFEKPPHNQIIDTEYGRLIVNRNAGEFDSLAKVGDSEARQAIHNLCVYALCCGPGAMVLDIGACWGTFTIPLGVTLARSGGKVIAFEPQRWLYHCICGSIALNDLDNVVCNLAAVGAEVGHCTVPGMDYTKRASFGSLPIVEYASEYAMSDTGQEPDKEHGQIVRMVTVDSLRPKPDLIKIDTEGMEILVLDGAVNTIHQYHPIVYVEHLKSGVEDIEKWFKDKPYDLHMDGCSYLCVPHSRREMMPKIVRVDDV